MIVWIVFFCIGRFVFYVNGYVQWGSGLRDIDTMNMFKIVFWVKVFI